jgi:DNA-binding MarR family transcriptional regulator
MTVMAKSEVASDPNEMAPLRGAFLETVYLVERAHHQMLEVIKDELDRRNELGINGVQAMLIFEIGDRVITAAQLYKRGHYQGSNISHNLKKLTAAGYVSQGRSQTDRRSIPVQLTKKGEKVTEMLDALFNRHLSSLAAVINVGDRELGVTNAILGRLERWGGQPKTRRSRRSGLLLSDYVDRVGAKSIRGVTNCADQTPVDGTVK